MTVFRYTGVLCAFILLWLPAAAQSAPGSTESIVTPLDGPALTVDDDSLGFDAVRGISPGPFFSPSAAADMFFRMEAPLFETREQRALRVQNRVVSTLMPSVRADLSQTFRPIPYQYYPLLLVAGFFLTPQFAVPYGWYPMMSASNNFVIAMTPGWAPEETSIYSPSVIPQTIDLEYDFSTGTYKQKMVDWRTYEKRVNAINPMNFNVTPVPRIPINDVEKRIMNLGM